MAMFNVAKARVKANRNHIKHKNNGFTLMELIIVIIILGVMSVGIGGFITLSTQTYVNVTERDELTSSARFAIERLNREIRNAVPNSIRVAVDNSTNPTKQCLEFVPIVASTVYTKLAVIPDAPVNNLTVIPFLTLKNANYVCNSCGDRVIVYPLSPEDVYQNHNDNISKVFTIASYLDPVINLTAGNVNFAEYSPTSRAFIFNEPVSYCVEHGVLNRYSSYNFNQNQELPPNSNILNGNYSLMAQNVFFNKNNLPFTVLPASLQRNAVVQIKLNFTRDTETVIFDHAIHINNIP